MSLLLIRWIALSSVWTTGASLWKLKLSSLKKKIDSDGGSKSRSNVVLITWWKYIFEAFKGGGEGGIRTCEITGGEREPPRALACPHSLFPFSFPPLFFWSSSFFFRTPLKCSRIFLAENPTRMPSLQARDSKTSLIERTTTTSLRLSCNALHKSAGRTR